MEETNQNPTPGLEAETREMIWTTPLTDQCLDDVVLPPGGGIRRAPLEGLPGLMKKIPLPEYLTHEGRDLRIDFLRGYFVFAMIVDHVRGPSPLYLITGGNRFYTSAAEGFILTSGLVAGLVYRRLIQRDGLSKSLLKVLNRAVTLYLLTIGLTFMFAIFSEISLMSWSQGIDFSNPLGFVVSVLTLHQTYYLVDVMLLYTILFLVVPLAFVLLDRDKTRWLLAASIILYALFQFFPDLAGLPWPIKGNYLFDFSAWQLLFFGGLALGYNQEKIPSLSCRATRLGLIFTGIGTVLLIVVFYLVDPPTSAMPTGIAITSPILEETRIWLQDYVFSKGGLRPGRLITSAVTFSFIFFAITHLWHHLNRWLGWLLLPLGQYALYAYTAHIAVVGVVALILKPFNLVYPGPQLLNLGIQIASVLLIWFIAKNQFIAPTNTTRKYWNYSPVVMAVLILVVFSFSPKTTNPALTAPTTNPNTGNIPRRYGSPVPRLAQQTASTPVPSNITALPAAVPQQPPASAPVTNSVPARSYTPSTQAGSDMVSTPYLGSITGVLRERWFYSAELDRVMPYWIYLPPDYDDFSRRYPVAYMLHGRGGHREEWVAYGLIDTVDQQINGRQINPFIVVMPQGDRSFWVNHTDDGERWGEYIVRDLVGHIDSSYRTIRAPSARAIGGLSMGGFGALVNGFYNPDVFSVIGAHSPSIRPDDGSSEYAFLGTGGEYAARSPEALLKSQTNLGSLQIWIDVGEEDDWAPAAIRLHEALQQAGIDHVWQLFPGGHDYDYWMGHALDYARFYGYALFRN